jgi:NOL1/NOP2/sun family putative RNA methylase
MKFKDNLKAYMCEEELNKLENSLNQEEVKGVRVNISKTNKDFILSKFPGLKNHPFIDYAFIYNKEQLSLGKHPYHLQGLYYIQEPSAMMVTYLLDIKPGDKVIDLSAAPGGKSSHAASILNNTGLLISNDISYKRALELSKNIERSGVRNVVVTSNEIKDFLPNFSGYFDKVILDAPCSGEGMFRKNESVEADWSNEKVDRLCSLQKELILQAYQLLKKDGIMVYSTCTFEKRENEDVIKYLLDNTNAELVTIFDNEVFSRGIDLPSAIRLYPFKFNGEGHFICLIKCLDDHINNPSINKKEKINKSIIKLYQEFEESTLNIKLEGEFRLYQDNLYLVASSNINTNKLNVLRDGLHLGQIVKDRFVPSHSLALFLKKEDVKQVEDLEYPSINANKYLQGDVIPTKYKNGYVLVCIDGYSLTWGKATNGVLKNHLPKGLRD